MSSDKKNGFGFELRNALLAGGGHRPVARFWCKDCGGNLDIPWKSTSAINPEKIAKEARAKGWEVDGFTDAKTFCVTCVERRKSARKSDVDSELNKLKEKMMGTTTMAPTVTAIDTKQVPLRPPSADQRVAIRALLEKHFDEGLGCYSIDWSDQAIAEKVNVPRISVEQLREFAYGPIRVSAVELELRNAVVALRKEIVDQKQATEGILQQIRGDYDKAMAKVADLEKRLTAKAAA